MGELAGHEEISYRERVSEFQKVAPVSCRLSRAAPPATTAAGRRRCSWNLISAGLQPTLPPQSVRDREESRCSSWSAPWPRHLPSHASLPTQPLPAQTLRIAIPAEIA